MLKAIHNSSSHSLKIKLTWIYILNAIDIVFTFSLLKTGLFYEANNLMVPIVTDATLSISTKLILPGLLIIYLLWKLDIPYFSNLKVCNYLMCLVLLIYLIIDVLHFYYLYNYLIL